MKLLLIIFPLINALYTGSNINNAKDYPRIRPTKYNLTINRPLFHFTPSFGWMNDPNGCFYDKTAKVYHLYFQHNPQTTKWGLPLYWGHAISYDLNTWKQQSNAIGPPDGKSGAYSGSIFIDSSNLTGLFKEEIDPEQRIVAMWTYDFTSNNYHHEYQWLSFSEDGGYTFITPSNEGDDNLYNGKHINPVVIAYKDNTTEFTPENEQTEFRDPSISKYLGTAKDSDGNDKEDRKFIMTIARSQEYKVSFYESNDGIEYKESSKYELGGYLGHQYECPNFGHLKNKEQRDGEESSYWVLFVLINPGSITGGSANWYVIGTFGRENGYLTDKLVFTQTHKYLNIFDYGKDFYALQIYFVNPDSDEELKEGYDTLTLIPWTTNWQYSQTTPTDPWRGGMGIPREFYLSHISLNSQVSFLTLKQRPILNHKNFENSINTAVTPIKISSLSLSSENREIDYSKGAFGAFEFLLEFNITGEGTETPEFNVLFKGGSIPEEYLEIGYNNDGPIVYINRGHSNVQFVKKNAMFNHNTAIYIQEKKTNYNIYGLIDRNILEVFFNIDDYEKKTSFIASTQTFFFTGGNFVSSVEFVPVTEGRFDIQFYGRQLGEFDFTEGAS